MSLCVGWENRPERGFNDCFISPLTHSSKQGNPDQTSRSLVYDLGLHGFQILCPSTKPSVGFTD